MSLAMIVDTRALGTPNQLGTVVGALMTGGLGMAAWEQWHDGLAAGHWLLPLGAALACAAWGLLESRRARRNRSLCLRIAADGGLRLAQPPEEASVEAVVVAAWMLGSLVYLRVRATTKVDPAAPTADGRQSEPVFGRRDCRLLMTRREFSESDWHGLRRWLVWHRRSARAVDVVG